MNDKITKITKVEIKGLWNRFDLVWNLQADVNILSGINGSGKSTILNCVAQFTSSGVILNELNELIKEAKITFDNGEFMTFERIQKNLKDLEDMSETDEESKIIVSKSKQKYGTDYSKQKTVTYSKTTFNNLKLLNPNVLQAIKIDIISTFDKPILEAGRKPDENVRTELDRDIFHLQKKYLDYQLNISKKLIQIINREHTQDELKENQQQKNRFLDIIDNLFQYTDKKINRDKNEIVFLSGDQEITAYQLSSGEKQMLVILLTVLVQDNQPAILFMDEPEVSLHFDWQKTLIEYIRELNPNIQIILATHSPAVIINGWHDKVSDVRDLITFDSRNPKK